MIGKNIQSRTDSGTSFKSLVQYINDPEKTINRGQHVVFTNNIVSLETAHIEMQAEAAQNPLVSDPVVHSVISWPAYEKPTPAQMHEAIQIYLNHIGADTSPTGHQYVAPAHFNTDEWHIHIALNRVHPATGKPLHMEWSNTRIAEAVKKIEIRQGWDVTQNKLVEVERDESGRPVLGDDGLAKIVAVKATANIKYGEISPAALDMELRTGEVSYSRYVRDVVAPAVEEYTKQDGASWLGLNKMLNERYESHIAVAGAGYVVASNNMNPADRAGKRVMGEWSKLGAMDTALSRGDTQQSFKAVRDKLGPTDDVIRQAKQDKAEMREQMLTAGFGRYVKDKVSPAMIDYLEGDTPTWLGLNKMLNEQFDVRLQTAGGGYVIQSNTGSASDRVPARSLGNWARIREVDKRMDGLSFADVKNDFKQPARREFVKWSGLSAEQRMEQREAERQRFYNRSEGEGRWYDVNQQRADDAVELYKRYQAIDKERRRAAASELSDGDRANMRVARKQLAVFRDAKKAEIAQLSEDEQKLARKRLAATLADMRRQLMRINKMKLDEAREAMMQQLGTSSLKRRRHGSFREFLDEHRDVREQVDSFSRSKHQLPALSVDERAAARPEASDFIEGSEIRDANLRHIGVDRGHRVELLKTDPGAIRDAAQYLRNKFGDSIAIRAAGNDYMRIAIGRGVDRGPKLDR